MQVAVENQPNDFSLLRDDLRLAICPFSVADNPSVREGKFTVLISHALTASYILGNRLAFGLSKGAQYGEDHLRVHGGGVDVLFFKYHRDSHLFQHSDVLNTVQCVAGEAGNGFCQYKVDFALLAVLNHLVKTVTLSELISTLFGSVLGGAEKSGKTGTVTTNGGKLNVRTGAGLDNYAFAQLPNGTVVEVVGTDGDWYMVRLPEKIGYVYSGYMTLSDTGGEADSGLSLSIDPDKLSELFEQLMGGSGDAALTPDGNLSLIDDIGSSTRSGKQFITVETRNGNVFYLIIDRDDEGEETVHFLKQVDEADLLTLMGDDAPAAEVPAVCNCKEKCAAGAVNTNCPVCKNNLSECSGKEVVAEPEPEAEQPEKKSSGGLLVIVLLLVLAGGGAFAYVKFIKPKQGMKVSTDPDDYDFEDEEMVNEDDIV